MAKHHFVNCPSCNHFFEAPSQRHGAHNASIGATEIIRPQPDARVEKALQDYDDGKALDKLPTKENWETEAVKEAVANSEVERWKRRASAAHDEQRKAKE